MEAYPLSFENSKNAFAYKRDAQLKKAAFLFSSMNYAWLVKWGTRITPWMMKLGVPIKGIIRKTLFEQFVGGETLKETAAVVNHLQQFGVSIILDYGVEGKQGEENFDHSCDKFIEVINYAATQPNIPFISVKITGFARFSLLEKLDAAADIKSGYSGQVHTEILTTGEKEEWQRVVDRMNRIVQAAQTGRVGVLVDAEESWIQDPVDALTMQMMRRYNDRDAVVYNTVQLYRSDRLDFLQHCILDAEVNRYKLGVKLVRGAYLEKERARAAKFGYASPIQKDKNSTDDDYNAALRLTMDHLQQMAIIVASHNEESNYYATRLMQERGIEKHDLRVHFSQLYGMSDHITFNLARAGYSVSKYLPFGPIDDVIPYLMRRATENSSVSGQTGRELALIRKEIRRRSANRNRN